MRSTPLNTFSISGRTSPCVSDMTPTNIPRMLLDFASHRNLTSVTLSHMTRRNTSGRSLTELQQAILDFVWENGPVTADQVRQALEPKYPLKDPTIRTMLRRLEARGYVTHRT